MQRSPYLRIMALCAMLLGLASCEKDPSLAAGRMALTFDDGPDSVYTVRILDILKEKNVKATFFVTGQHARRYPHLLERMRREGHIIGNHTYTHLYLPNASDSLMDWEVQRTERFIDRYAHTGGAHFFRPPYGFIKPEQRQRLESEGFRVVLWNIDPLDYNLQRTPTPNDIADRVLVCRKNNGVVLMHSADYADVGSRENTVLALPRIIDELRNKYNYSLVTIDQVAPLH